MITKKNVTRISKQVADLNLTVMQFWTLATAEKKLHLLSEKVCNGEITDEVFDRRSSLILQNLQNTMDLHIYHQTDPRGSALYVNYAPMTTSNYSEIGTPIYF